MTFPRRLDLVKELARRACRQLHLETNLAQQAERLVPVREPDRRRLPNWPLADPAASTDHIGRPGTLLPPTCRAEQQDDIGQDRH